jgi:phytoene dehydrogenase-like protein
MVGQGLIPFRAKRRCEIGGRMSKEASADVIIAGGGHNGLVAACYLAKAGVDVLVVEAHTKVGGMTATSPMLGLETHLINEGSIQASLWNASTIDAELELSTKYGLEPVFCDPFHVHLGPKEESLAFWRDYRKTAEEIARFSTKDAKTWLSLCTTIDHAAQIGVHMMRTSAVKPEWSHTSKAIGAALKRIGKWGDIAQWALPSFAEAVERFEHPIVRGAFTSLLPFGDFRHDIGGWGMIYFGLIHRYGCCLFKGGTGALPLSLLRCFEDHGGRVCCDAPIDQLIVRDGRVCGVRLINGDELEARKAVMTTMNPKAVLTRMLPDGVLDSHQLLRARHIPTRNRGIVDYNLNIAVKGKLQLPRHQAWRKDDVDLRRPCVTWNTHEQSLDAYDACDRGQIPEMLPGLAQLTTAIDPSMAPAEHDTLWYWCGITPSWPEMGWDQALGVITDKVIRNLGEYYEGIEDLIIGTLPKGPNEIEKRFWALDGNVFHVDTFITRMGPLKPAIGFAGYRTPVPGLYLSGGGTHPVAGICGMPGQNAARRLLQDIH